MVQALSVETRCPLPTTDDEQARTAAIHSVLKMLGADLSVALGASLVNAYGPRWAEAVSRGYRDTNP